MRQPGQIETLNRTWPFGFPRGARLDKLDQTRVEEVAAIINERRRLKLGYLSPASLYAAATV